MNFGYNGLGQQYYIGFGGEEIVRFYDDLGRVVRILRPGKGEVQYGYDAVGNRTQLTYPGGNSAIYTYDAGNRLQSVTAGWLNASVSYAYDAANRLTTATTSSGIQSNYVYDDAGRLSSVAHVADYQTKSSFEYTYNAASQRTQAVENIVMPDGQAVTTNIAYSYDGLNRLTAADYDSGIYFHYTYDAVGNRLQETKKIDPQLPEVVNTYEYDVANRLTSVNGAAYQWDNNGNLLNDGVNTYTYNAANQLKTVTGAGVTASYEYNGLGDRVSQTVNGTTTNYTLDLNAGLTQVLADNTTTYLYGLNRVGQFAGNDSAYFLDDALGSVRQLLDGSRSVTLAKSYTPYGEILSSSGDGQTVYGFTGEMQGSGLVYLRARYYQDSIGRFLTRDTWEGDQYTPMSYNPWLYGYSNPANNIDPTGRCPSGSGGEPCRNYAKQIEKTYRVHLDLGESNPYEQICDESNKFYNWNLDELIAASDSLKMVRLFLNYTLFPYDSTLGNGEVVFKRVIMNTVGGKYAITDPQFNEAFPPYSKLLGIKEVWVELDNAVFGQRIVEAGRVSTIIHELFHAFEWTVAGSGYTKAVNEMISQKGPWVDTTPDSRGYCGPTKYACKDPGENFASAAAIYSMDYLSKKGVSFAATVIQDSSFINNLPNESEEYRTAIDPGKWNDDGKRFRALEELFFGRKQ